MIGARGLGLAISLAFLALLPLSSAQAFPPYRSTDADTAESVHPGVANWTGAYHARL